MQFAGRNYLSSRQVSERYAIGMRTFYRYTKREDFPKPILREGRMFFAEDELLEWERNLVRSQIDQRAA